MAKKWVAPRTCAFNVEFYLVQYEKKVERVAEIHSHNLLG
jgi:hypothetical protein